MTGDYPVHIELTSPPRFERIQLLLRVILSIALGWVGVTAGWLVCLLYFALPVLAAIAISAWGSERYTSEIGPRVWRVLAWLLQLSSYMALTVDRFPVGDPHPVEVEVRVQGTPTVGSALARLVTSIPSGLVLMVLWCVSCLMWIVGACFVIFTEHVPHSILAFQRGVVRWQARLVAYHASLVVEYPPFSFDTDEGHGTPVAIAR